MCMNPVAKISPFVQGDYNIPFNLCQSCCRDGKGLIGDKKNRSSSVNLVSCNIILIQ